jgi:hypothetical protein
MLVPRATLDRIAAGEVTLQFRRWGRPTVRAGGRLRTAVGELAIDSVEPVPRARITAADAHAAGFPSRKALLARLDRREDGRIYRIAVRLAGPDPRLALRERTALTEAELDDLRLRLDRWDRGGSGGPWTRATLDLIAERPGVLAADLAALAGREKLPFKRDVRKLKELGLTESLPTGYRLSPRGRAARARLGSG